MPKKTKNDFMGELTEEGAEYLTFLREEYNVTPYKLSKTGKIAYDENKIDDAPCQNSFRKFIENDSLEIENLKRCWTVLEYFCKLKLPRKVVLPESSRAYRVIEARRDEASPKRDRRGCTSRRMPKYNVTFYGRAEILAALDAALKRDPLRSVTEPIALTGLPGTGKTQTASSYAHAHSKEFNGIFWINAETADEIKASIAEFAEDLGLPKPQRATQEKAIQATLDWFEANEDWLLVFDNVENIEDILCYLPLSNNGSLLLTTRASDTSNWFTPIEINKLAEDMGALLLLCCARILNKSQSLADADDSERAAALQLSCMMDGLPLALAHMGAYMRQQKMTAAECLKEYQKDGLVFLEQYADRDHDSITKTFSKAIEQIEKKGKHGSDAAKLIRLCAFLSPDAIPEFLFTAGEFQDCLRSRAAIFAYSLMDRNAITRTLSIHRLLQEVIRHSMTAEERKGWARRAVFAIADATPDFEADQWPLYALLLPHWKIGEEYIHTYQIEEPQSARMLYQYGRYLRVLLQYKKSKASLSEALAIYKRTLGDKHGQTADCLEALGGLCREEGNFDDAIKFYDQELLIRNEIERPHTFAIANLLNNRAAVYIAQENYDEAEKSLRAALEIFENLRGLNDPRAADAMNQLAGVYRVWGRYEESEKLYKQALEVYTSILGPDHMDTATGLSNYALLLIQLARYTEAETLCAQILETHKKIFGAELYHPDTAQVFWRLAIIFEKQAKFDEANAMFQKTEAIFRKAWSDEHPILSKLLTRYSEFKEAHMSARQAEQVIK